MNTSRGSRSRIAATIGPSFVVSMPRVSLRLVARAGSAAEIRRTTVLVTIAGISVAAIIVVVARIVSPSRIGHAHLARLKPSRYVLNSGDAWVTSIGVATPRSAHLSCKIIRISSVFDFSKGLLICGLRVRFPPGSPLSSANFGSSGSPTSLCPCRAGRCRWPSRSPRCRPGPAP